MNDKRYTFVKTIRYLVVDNNGYVPVQRDEYICEDCGSMVALRGSHDSWHAKLEGPQVYG